MVVGSGKLDELGPEDVPRHHAGLVDGRQPVVDAMEDERRDPDHGQDVPDNESSSNPTTSLTGVTYTCRPRRGYANRGATPESQTRSQAPAADARIAGIPNRRTIPRFAWRPTSPSLNTPLRKWTTAVNATARSMGKNSAKAGSRSVPRRSRKGTSAPTPGTRPRRRQGSSHRRVEAGGPTK